MVEPHFGHIVDQASRQLAIVQEFAFDAAMPGAEVDLVDRHRQVLPIRPGAAPHPLSVLPRIRAARGNDRGGLRTQLEPPAVRVRLQKDLPGMGVADLELVERAGHELGDEEFPHPGSAARAHRVAAPIPPVEVSDDAHALRVGRPHCKQYAADARDLVLTGAKEVVRLQMLAFREQMEIEVGKLGSICVRIVRDVFAMLVIAPDQTVMVGQCGNIATPLEDGRPMHARHAPISLGDRHLGRMGQMRADKDALVRRMSAQHRERVVVARLQDPDQIVVQAGLGRDRFPIHPPPPNHGQKSCARISWPRRQSSRP